MTNVNMADNNQNINQTINQTITQTSIPQSINNNKIYQNTKQTIIEKTIKTNNKTNDINTKLNLFPINDNQKTNIQNITQNTLQNNQLITPQNNNLNTTTGVSKEITQITKNIHNEKIDINNPQNKVEKKITTITTTTENGEKITTNIITNGINIENNNITSNNTLINNTTSINSNNPNFLNTLNNAINHGINESKIEIINDEPPKTYIGDPNKASNIKINPSVDIFYPIQNSNRIIIESLEENSSTGKQIEKIIEFPITIELTKFLEGSGFCNYKKKTIYLWWYI
jgi:hypothetical protein